MGTLGWSLAVSGAVMLLCGLSLEGSSFLCIFSWLWSSVAPNIKPKKGRLTQWAALYIESLSLHGSIMLTCCASLAAAAASPVSTDATLTPSLTGLSCLGRVGVTRARSKGTVRKTISYVQAQVAVKDL